MNIFSKKMFSRIDTRSVLTPTGTKSVDAFSISVHPVTVGEYDYFCQETGYLTDAERSGSPAVFKQSEKLQYVSKKSSIPINGLPACMISYDDAAKFCNWAKVAMPTDAEWVAASVVDWSKTYPDSAKGYKASESRAMIRSHGYELTSSLADETVPMRSIFELSGPRRLDVDSLPRADDVTVRFGPVYAIFDGWEKLHFTMRCPRNFFSFHVGFRVLMRT